MLRAYAAILYYAMSIRYADGAPARHAMPLMLRYAYVIDAPWPITAAAGDTPLMMLSLDDVALMLRRAMIAPFCQRYAIMMLLILMRDARHGAVCCLLSLFAAIAAMLPC